MSGSMLMLLGGSGGRVEITDRTIGDNRVGVAASASLDLGNDGVLRRVTSGAGSIATTGEWFLGAYAGVGALYEARVTLITGTLTSGTVGSWVAISGSPSWNVTQAAGGTKTCTFTLEIRRASDAVVQDTATITLEATREP